MIPSWYWPWVRWRLGEGEFKGDPRNSARRPAEIPKSISPWAYEKLRLFLAARVKAATDPAELRFWRQMGMWVTRIDHFPVSYVVAYGDGEYPVIVVPCLYGTEMEANTEGLAEYVAELKKLGFKVAGSQWGRATDMASAQAETAAACVAIDRFGFDGWVMNGEKVYEGGGKSLAYVQRFRLMKPDFPLAWSPEARLGLDHTYLVANRVAYMPQVYPLENGVTMAYAVEWALNFGYNLANVIPLIGAYTVKDERFPAATYRDEAKALGLDNLILYTANQCADVPQYFRDLVIR